MDYKRITERVRNHILVESQTDALKYLAELEDKIAQGKLIELPCKVGDSFYSYERFKYQCLGIEITNDGIYLKTIYDMKFLYGKDCFLTREEAEKRSKELQE